MLLTYTIGSSDTQKLRVEARVDDEIVLSGMIGTAARLPQESSFRIERFLRRPGKHAVKFKVMAGKPGWSIQLGVFQDDAADSNKIAYRNIDSSGDERYSSAKAGDWIEIDPITIEIPEHR
jgi:hypothetical protein